MTARKSITLTTRDLGHFVSAFAAAFVTEWQAGGFSLHRAALFSLAPAAATVAFRQVFQPKPATTATLTSVNVAPGTIVVNGKPAPSAAALTAIAAAQKLSA